LTELKLIESAKRGKMRAFKKLYELNVAQLYSFMKQFSSDIDEVEEWVQRAFIKAFNRLNQFKGNSKFSTWLFRIAINEMKTDYLKYGKITFLNLDELIETQSVEDVKGFETINDINLLLLEVDELKRAVFLLVEVEGYSHREAADILEISEAFSRTTLHRTKRILKEKFVDIGI